MHDPQPLAGIRVLDFTRLVPGPFCSLLLADLGATVIKVEDLQLGDYTRFLPPMVTPTKGNLFELLNRNKLGLALDLKQPRGLDVARRLAAGCDVVLESFRPGVPERLGIAYEQLLPLRPGLIYCSLSGYGQHTALAKRAGHDLNYLGLSGYLANHAAGASPGLPGTQLADLVSGSLHAVIGVLAALLRRQASGKGAYLDLSICHGFLGLLPVLYASAAAVPEADDPFAGYLFGANPQYGVYATADGGHVTLAAIEPKFWTSFCAAAARPDLLTADLASAEGRKDLAAKLTALFATYTQAEVTARFGSADCCVEPVLDLARALALLDRPEYPLTTTGSVEGRPFRYLAPLPLLLQGQAAAVAPVPAPDHGQHSREILTEVASYDRSDIDALLAEGVIRQA